MTSQWSGLMGDLISGNIDISLGKIQRNKMEEKRIKPECVKQYNKQNKITNCKCKLNPPYK